MDVDCISRTFSSHAAGIGRRHSVAALVSGTAGTLRRQASEARKKHKKTCK